ncbi:hypothetical protein FH972_026216 [Carpinus fangiana]|uniref:Amino acid permease/ SLC12A domain-containing protein n=1 Tax=Carpinus fangiana TaxID=176857 RepID=A0A5N6L3B4_9ROSI|nr:hypothetical protein FH972_026216 [Carpinus fangiana]
MADIKITNASMEKRAIEDINGEDATLEQLGYHQEQCSAYPVAGGQYSWVAIVAPKSIARGMSYICGWFMLIGILAMGATNNFITANFILGMAQLAHPSYTIERWHTALVSWLVALVATNINLFIPHLLNTFSRGMLLWNVSAFIIVVATILATNDHKRDSAFVFSTFENSTGFGTGYTAVLGLLQTCFGMCCYDAPAHMTEEMHDARRSAPRAIIMSVILGAVTGLGFLIAVSFCMGDITAVATSSTGVPLIQIFYDSTGSVIGTCFLASLITIISLVAAIGLTAEGSRSIYAFARDNGLPGSTFLSAVRSKYCIPIPALVMTAVIQMALNAIYFGSYTGFLTVTSIATAGFYLSYSMPLLARLLSPSHNFNGPYNLGSLSWPLSLVSLLFLLFAFITFNFPTLNPVDAENMNYCVAAVGGVMFIAAIFWFTTGRKHFSGPVVALIGQEHNH